MAVINKIRNNVGLVITIIGLSMVAFILTDLFKSTSSIFGGNQNEVGIVAGTSVDYAYFNAELQNAIYQEQQRSGSQTVTDDVRQNLVNRAWENVITEIIMNQEYESAGISVSSAELMDMFIGPDPSPIVVQQFAQGGQPYDPNQMKQIMARSKTEPEVKKYLEDLEKYMVAMRLQEKYMNVIRSGMMVSRSEAKNAYMEDNRKVSFEFVGVNYSSIPDTAVEVTDDDIRRYLAKHKEAYKIKEMEADVRYVPFYKVASAADSAEALAYLNKIRPEFLASTNDSLFVSAKSAFPFDTTYKAMGEMDPQTQEYLAGVGKDSVVGPFFDGGYYRMLKISDVKDAEKPRVKVKHLLVMVRGFTVEDTLRAKLKADSLLRVTNLKNFDEQVEKNSEDNQTVTTGGSLGWYTQGRMGGDFDEKIYNLPLNQISVLKSSRGYHLVYLEEKTSRVYQVANVVKQVVPSSNTLRALFKDADKYAGAAHDASDFDAFARTKGVQVIQLPAIAPSKMIIPGLLNTGELVRWALTEKPGSISNVIETGDAFVVAYLANRKEEGYMTVEDIRKNMDRKILNAKKAEIIKEKLANVTAQDLNTIREKLGKGAFVSQADEVSFASATAPGIGNDPIVTGKAFAQEINKISPPIAGNTGVYVIKVTKRTEPTAPTDQDINMYQQNLASTKSNSMASKVYLGIRDHANVKDYRYKFGF